MLERGSFQILDDRPDGVILAEVVVEPQPIEPSVSVPIKQVDASRVGVGYLRAAAIGEGTETVNQTGPPRVWSTPCLLRLRPRWKGQHCAYPVCAGVPPRCAVA